MRKILLWSWKTVMIIHQISEIIKKAIEEEGGNFALVHKVRARSGLSRESFDRAIDYLAHSDQRYKIELMGGDPSLLTEQEIADCIKKDGTLFITMAWREDVEEELPKPMPVEKQPIPEPVFEKRKIARAYPARGRKYRKIKQIPYDLQKIQIPGRLPRWMISALENQGDIGKILEEILLQSGLKQEDSEKS
jgi:hypothetical protein